MHYQPYHSSGISPFTGSLIQHHNASEASRKHSFGHNHLSSTFYLRSFFFASRFCVTSVLNFSLVASSQFPSVMPMDKRPLTSIAFLEEFIRYNHLLHHQIPVSCHLPGFCPHIQSLHAPPLPISISRSHLLCTSLYIAFYEKQPITAIVCLISILQSRNLA